MERPSGWVNEGSMFVQTEKNSDVFVISDDDGGAAPVLWVNNFSNGQYNLFALENDWYFRSKIHLQMHKWYI